MYESPHSLPHLCPTSAYHQPEWFAVEQQQLLRQSWFPVGDRSMLAKHGDFLTMSSLGNEIQVRNFQGDVCALSNVCAHRHCLIDSRTQGHSDQMQCQYHGWEYGADGFTRKIPGAKEFAPIDREMLSIPKYNSQWCGNLLFVRTSSDGPSLQEHLGPLYEKISDRFGEGWKCFLRMDFEYESNWKVPIENSLEAYHVPMVHPNTFVDRPSEDATFHEIGSTHTAFRTAMPFAAHSKLQAWFHRAERILMKALGKVSTGSYWQHHLFPNLLCSFTDAISLCHLVTPISPTRSRSTVWQFGVFPEGKLRRSIAWIWGRLEAAITKRILMEDLNLYGAIQRGLNASHSSGRLARSEERIHAFQRYLLDRCGPNPTAQLP